MILKEKEVKINIPDNLQWEKLDEWDFYKRNLSNAGLKAVDFVFYGEKILVFLEIKNFNPDLSSIRDPKVLKKKKEEILKQFDKYEITIGLANKLVSSIYMIFGKKLNEERKIVFCVLLILPDELKTYLDFINQALQKLKTEEGKLLKVKVLLLEDINKVEQIVSNLAQQ